MKSLGNKYIKDEIELKDIHLQPFGLSQSKCSSLLQNEVFVISMIKGYLLFHSKPHKLNKFNEFKVLFDNYIEQRKLKWKSNACSNILYTDLEDVIVRKTPLVMWKMFDIFIDNTNIYDLKKVLCLLFIIYCSHNTHIVDLVNYIKMRCVILLNNHIKIFIEEKIDVEVIVKLIQLGIITDSVECLTNVIIIMSQILPYLTGNSRKRIVFDCILHKYFNNLFYHWSDFVRNGFQTLLLYYLTLARFNKLDTLHPREKELYNDRNKMNYNALNFDKLVVIEVEKKINLLKDIVRDLNKTDNQYVVIMNALQSYDNEYLLWSKEYKTTKPSIVFFIPHD